MDKLRGVTCSGICAEPGTASTTEANLRLGLFYLARGFADGEQIISREWMDEATRKQVDTTPDPGTADAKVGYGWQLPWHDHRSCR